MKNTALVIVVAVAAAFTFALLGQEPRNPPLPSSPMGADSTVVAKLSEIVEIRKASIERAKIRYASGDVDEDQMSTLSLALAEARITLAQEQGQKEAVLAALKEIVSIHERRFRLVQARSFDQATKEDVATSRLALLESEVRLLKAQH